MEALIPGQLDGKSVFDLGCGLGDLSRHARSAGAATVLSIDASQRMLAEAGRRTEDSGIVYEQCSIESFEFQESKYDLVLASLVLHYVCSYETVALKIARSLTPGGKFIFSIEHPICTSIGLNKWHLDAKGEPDFWPVDHYWDAGPRESQWFIGGIIKYHRTLKTYITVLIESGFRFTGSWSRYQRRR